MLELQHLCCYYSITFASVLKLLLLNFEMLCQLGKEKGEIPPPVKHLFIPLPSRKIRPVDSTAPNKIVLSSL